MSRWRSQRVPSGSFCVANTRCKRTQTAIGYYHYYCNKFVRVLSLFGDRNVFLSEVCGSFENKRALPPVLKQETCDSCNTTYENPNALGQPALMLYSSRPKRFKTVMFVLGLSAVRTKKTVIEVATNCRLVIQRWRKIITSYGKNEDKMTKFRVTYGHISVSSKQCRITNWVMRAQAQLNNFGPFHAFLTQCKAYGKHASETQRSCNLP
jgi:hypothetical protein